MRNENKLFSLFVSHRVNQIRSSSNIADWDCIEGKLNVADDSPRVIKCKDFTSNSRYLKGPEFLREFSLKEVLQRDELVRQNEPAEIISNTSKSQQTDNQVSSIVPWERFSLLQKLLNVVSAVINIAKYWRQKVEDKNLSYTRNTTVNYVQDVTSLISKHVQQERYRNEYLNLLQRKTRKNRKLIQLQPVLKNHLICVGGRLKHAKISAESKHQAIIHSNHHLTNLVLYIYQNNHHGGREQLLALSRGRYWIANRKHLAIKVTYNCLYCKRQRVKTQLQLMVDLPLSYLQPPFSFSGVDYFGPVTVKRGHRRRSLSGHIKRYFCLFTSLAFHAIHLELCDDISADSFIMALRRFVSRRGYPLKIMSDKGTNIVGANNQNV